MLEAACSRVEALQRYEAAATAVEVSGSWLLVDPAGLCRPDSCVTCRSPGPLACQPQRMQNDVRRAVNTTTMLKACLPASVLRMLCLLLKVQCSKEREKKELCSNIWHFGSYAAAVAFTP